MPRTRPRSTAQITGCSMAAPPNGQWSDTMRSPSPCRSAWAAKPWAVSASATACSAVRKDRWAAPGPSAPVSRTVRPWPRPSPCRTRRPTSSAIASAVVVGQQRQRLAEQRHERGRRGAPAARGSSPASRHAVPLRRPTRARLLRPVGDLDVATAGELVEVVPGHVGVQAEPLGHLGGGDAARASSLRSCTNR